jgi:Spy/CpxP family protein refolding chaperone
MNSLTRRLFGGAAATVLSVGLLGAAFAQEAPAPATDPAPKTTRSERGHGRRDMFKNLNLTDDQKAQLKSLRESHKPRRDALLNNASLSETDRKAQLRALRKEQREKTLAVLTPEQREKLKAQHPGRKGKRAQ